MTLAAGERAVPRPDPISGHRLSGPLDAVLDRISDLGIISFAIWTVLYHLGLIFGIATNPLLVIWLIASAGSAWFVARRGGPDGGIGGPLILLNTPVVVVGVLATVSAFMVGSATHSLWWLSWVVGLVVVLLGLRQVMRTGTDPADGHSRDRTSLAEVVQRSTPGSLLALGTALGLGAFSLFTLRVDPDDTFYVNRTVWVAERGTIPTRDTMFSSQTLHALPGAGIPVQSIEVFQGAIAHALGLAGGTAAYLLTPPVATFLAVWSIWRLVREWAPRRLALCFATAVVYLLWAAKDGGNLGVFFLARIQQGKVIFVAMVIPLLFLYLTRHLTASTPYNNLLLFAAGVAAIGYTSSATFLVPLICATAAGPLLLQRRVRMALLAMLPAVYPVLVGIVVHFSSATVDNFGRYWASESAFHFVFGTRWFSAIGWFAVFVGVLFARQGAARLIAWGTAAVLVILLAPGMFTVLNDVTGAHAVIWRVMWVAPVPVLVGLLAALPVPNWARWSAAVPAAVVMLAVIVVGLPLWSGQRSVSVQSSPTWRYSHTALTQARAIIRQFPHTGPILAPDSTMRAITLSTTRVHAVDPLRSYVTVLVEPADQHRARILLSDAISGRGKPPTPAATAQALQTLHVSVVCVRPSWLNRLHLFEAAGYTDTHNVAGEVCLTPPG